MDLLKPEYLRLTLCNWTNLHKERGATHYLQIGRYKGVPTLLTFDQHNFTNPSVGFVREMTSFFPDRILVISEETCQECMKELEKALNTEIIESGCMPPVETKCVHWDCGWCYHRDSPGGCVTQAQEGCPLRRD